MKKVLFLSIISFLFSSKIIAQNVGIGTATPPDKLSVVNAVPGYGVTHTYGPVTIGTYISNLNAQFGTKTNHPLQFFTNNSNAQLTLLQNGKIGIGSELPTEKLDVVGNILSEGNVAGLRFNDRADNLKGYQWYSTAGNAHLYRVQAPAGNVITVLENGNIGFNTSTPQTDLHVNPSGPGSILIGTNKNAGGYTNLEMGITAQTGGKGFIQTVSASGTAYGDLHINPNGGYVAINLPSTSTAFAPIDILQSSATRGIRLRNTLNSPFSDYWDIAADQQLNLYVNGTFVSHIGMDGTWNQVSDARFKTNILNMDNVLDKVKALQPKKYEYINNNPTHKISSGFLAQEVMPIFPELVSDFKTPKQDATDTTIYHAINYAGFSVIAIKAIQEQQVIIDRQQKSIEFLAGEIDKLKSSLSLIQRNK